MSCGMVLLLAMSEGAPRALGRELYGPGSRSFAVRSSEWVGGLRRSVGRRQQGESLPPAYTEAWTSVSAGADPRLYASSTPEAELSVRCEGPRSRSFPVRP